MADMLETSTGLSVNKVVALLTKEATLKECDRALDLELRKIVALHEGELTLKLLEDLINEFVCMSGSLGLPIIQGPQDLIDKVIKNDDTSKAEGSPLCSNFHYGRAEFDQRQWDDKYAYFSDSGLVNSWEAIPGINEKWADRRRTGSERDNAPTAPTDSRKYTAMRRKGARNVHMYEVFQQLPGLAALRSFTKRHTCIAVGEVSERVGSKHSKCFYSLPILTCLFPLNLDPNPPGRASS
jgi:hypothetical protein